jgi:hypothetical protein
MTVVYIGLVGVLMAWAGLGVASELRERPRRRASVEDLIRLLREQAPRPPADVKVIVWTDGTPAPPRRARVLQGCGPQP